MFTHVHVHTCECDPFKFTPYPLNVNYYSNPTWLGKENMRSNLYHISYAVTRHSTEEDLRDANEKRWQYWRRQQDNVLNQNDRAWAQTG